MLHLCVFSKDERYKSLPHTWSPAPGVSQPKKEYRSVHLDAKKSAPQVSQRHVLYGPGASRRYNMYRGDSLWLKASKIGGHLAGWFICSGKGIHLGRKCDSSLLPLCPAAVLFKL